jgi:hypothetical protein
VTYNGWENYETWVTAMYLDGNYEGGEQTYLEVLDLARQIEQDGDDARVALAQVLREYVSERVSPDGGLGADLVGSASDSVDWDTLAHHKLEER